MASTFLSPGASGGASTRAVADFFRTHAVVIGPVAVGVAILVSLMRRSKEKQPPAMPELIPFVSNTYQYLTDMRGFMVRATKALSASNIVQFRLGPKRVYLLQGQENIQALFRPGGEVGSEGFMTILMTNLWNMSPPDVARFATDKSGRLKHRAPGTEAVPDHERYWHSIHQLYAEFLSKGSYATQMAHKYTETLNALLEKEQPLGEWNEVMVYDFVKRNMAASAIVAMNGTHILELTPGFLDMFWGFDEIALYLVMGPPKWLDRKPYEKRDRFHEAVGKYVDAAWDNFDWEKNGEADWDEHFGSRFFRELAKWFRDRGFTKQSARGYISMVVYGLNSNSVPNATWALMEVIKDPELYKAVREEVQQAYVTDAATGKRTLDPQKLVSLPLLQSIFNEILRLHLSINLTREVVKPITIEGYPIEKGAMLQAITEIEHHHEKTWGTKDHPAKEFWAGRHLKYVPKSGTDELVPEFSMMAKGGAFVPFGGGTGICPGRYFAKQEILLTLASIVTRFDVEVVEWTRLDGSPSDRPAEDDPKYAGAASTPPDRDLKIRWKRLW